LIIVAEFEATGRLSMRRFHTFVDGNSVHGAGLFVGATVGLTVGAAVGAAVGAMVGFDVGSVVGTTVGITVGRTVGSTVGAALGAVDGLALGPLVGAVVGFVEGRGVAVGRGVFVGFTLPCAAARPALESDADPSTAVAGPNRPTVMATATTRTASAKGDRRSMSEA
jgi:hypothetical protein